MKRVGLFFLAVALVTGLASFAMVRWTARPSSANAGDAHAWLHRELNLTAEQEKALEPVEAAFAEKHQRLESALREANRHLAGVIAEDKAASPRVAAAVEHVHHCMGDLQKASIEHLFAMRAVLSPEQGDKLLKLAQRSLEESR